MTAEPISMKSVYIRGEEAKGVQWLVVQAVEKNICEKHLFVTFLMRYIKIVLAACHTNFTICPKRGNLFGVGIKVSSFFK